MKGLHRATLAALVTQGPWKTTDGELTGEGLVKVYLAVERGYNERGWLTGLPWLRGDRRCDRAFQILRKAGLVEYTGTPKRWEVRGT